jgi:hypothetical protein
MDTSKLDVGIDALDRMDAQAHRDGTCLCQETPCHDPAGCGSSAKQGHCHCGDPSRAVVREAAAALGRRGGKAGRGASQVRGDSDHYRALRAKRPAPQVWERNGEWSGVAVREGLKGWIVDTWGARTGARTGTRVLVAYSPTTPRTLRLDAPVNDGPGGALGAELVIEVARTAWTPDSGCRILRRGHIVR